MKRRNCNHHGSNYQQDAAKHKRRKSSKRALAIAIVLLVIGIALGLIFSEPQQLGTSPEAARGRCGRLSFNFLAGEGAARHLRGRHPGNSCAGFFAGVEVPEKQEVI